MDLGILRKKRKYILWKVGIKGIDQREIWGSTSYHKIQWDRRIPENLSGISHFQGKSFFFIFIFCHVGRAIHDIIPTNYNLNKKWTLIHFLFVLFNLQVPPYWIYPRPCLAYSTTWSKLDNSWSLIVKTPLIHSNFNTSFKHRFVAICSVQHALKEDLNYIYSITTFLGNLESQKHSN